MHAASPRAQLHMLHVQDRAAQSPFARKGSIADLYHHRTNAHTRSSAAEQDAGFALPVMTLGTAAAAGVHGRATSLESGSAIATPRSSVSHRRVSLNASHHTSGGGGYDKLLLFGFTRGAATAAIVAPTPSAHAFNDERAEPAAPAVASASASEASLANQQESASRRAEEIMTEQDAYTGEVNEDATAGALDASRDAARQSNWWNTRSSNSNSDRASYEYAASGVVFANCRVSDAGGSARTRDTAEASGVISVESQQKVLSEASAPWMVSSDSYDEPYM